MNVVLELDSFFVETLKRYYAFSRELSLLIACSMENVLYFIKGSDLYIFEGLPPTHRIIINLKLKLTLISCAVHC